LRGGEDVFSLPVGGGGLGWGYVPGGGERGRKKGGGTRFRYFLLWPRSKPIRQLFANKRSIIKEGKGNGVGSGHIERRGGGLREAFNNHLFRALRGKKKKSCWRPSTRWEKEEEEGISKGGGKKRTGSQITLVRKERHFYPRKGKKKKEG